MASQAPPHPWLVGFDLLLDPGGMFQDAFSIPDPSKAPTPGRTEAVLSV